MMDQKTFLAIGISILIIVFWSWLFPPPPPGEQPLPEDTVVTGEDKIYSTRSSRQDIGASLSSDTLQSHPVSEDKVETAKEILIETDYYRAVIDTRGGILKSLLLKKHQHFKSRITLGKWIPFLAGILGSGTPQVTTEENLVQMIKSDFVSLVQTLQIRFDGDEQLSQIFKDAVYSSTLDEIQIDVGDASQTLVLRSPIRDGIQVIKTIRFHATNYVIDYQVNVINRDEDAIRPLQIQHIFGEGHVFEQGMGQVNAHVGPVYVYNGELETLDANDLETEPGRIAQMEWLGIEDSYFITAVAALSDVHQGFFEVIPFNGEEGRELKPVFGVNLPPVDLNPEKQVQSNFQMYFGPKGENEMLKFGHNLFLSHDMTLEVLAKPLLKILIWIHSYVGNYGISIILLTVLVRVVLFPLTYKGSKSMKRMQQLQPKMLKIREKFKDKKQKLNAEMMALYRKNKVNPLGGCLPILLQLPIFFALYSALSTAVELRHEPFFAWIVDLSVPDGLGITPLLMGISMYLIQKMTPTGMMDPTQVKIMSMLPIIFTVFTFAFPTGLTLYWVTSNILSIGQQYVINRIKLPDLVEE